MPPTSPYLIWNSGECKECLNNSNLSINCQCCPDEPPPIPDTWDCVKQVSWEAALPDEYKCMLRTDGSGQFTSIQDCEDNCDTTGHILTPDGGGGPVDVGVMVPKKKPVDDVPDSENPIDKKLKEELKRYKQLL